MERDKYKILKEKISYLITNQLKQNNFEVLAVYVDFDYVVSSVPLEPSASPMIESYTIFLEIDYNGPLDGYDPYSFANHLKNMCDKARDSVSEYVITPEGKLTSNKNNILVSDAMIVTIDYKIEDTHKFKLEFRVDYEQ
jgi:hypothetical protein